MIWFIAVVIKNSGAAVRRPGLAGRRRDAAAGGDTGWGLGINIDRNIAGRNIIETGAP